eukprot:TRINITY_DN3984_c0_g1_i1.p1 TRINITY_DN3984_c0_g1~~TRINITY_DN3984_c0_g1_i1.p1  ORF type:complete len:484 (+),score=49.55 TRINITY_DN3984_c0_g1_i1:146-1597(+)
MEEQFEHPPDPRDYVHYHILTTMHAKLFKAASQKGATIVVPPDESVPRKPNADWFTKHTLVPSALFLNRYHIWSNDECEICKDDDYQTLSTAGSGWKVHINVRILHIETVHTQSGQEFYICFTAAPLVQGGRGRASSGSRSVVAEDKRIKQPVTLCAITALLTRVGVDLCEVEAKVEEFQQRLILTPGCEQPLSLEVRRLCSALIDRQMTLAGRPLSMALTEHNTDVAACSIDSYILARLHAQLMPFWRRSHRTEDRILRRCAAALREEGTLASLGAQPPFDRVPVENLKPAALELAQMQHAVTPLGKCACAKRAIDSVVQSCPTDIRTEIATDDLLPLFAFAIGLADSARLSACQDYVVCLGCSQLFQSEYGFAHATFSAAMELVRSQGSKILVARGESLSDDEGESEEEETASPEPAQSRIAAERRNRRASLRRSMISHGDSDRPTTPKAPEPPRVVVPAATAIAPRAVKDTGQFLASLLK